MAKVDRVQTGLEYLLKMKEYLGDDKMMQYINDRFPEHTAETKRKVKHYVDTAHAIKHKREKPVPMPMVNEAPKTPRQPKKSRFSI